MCHKVTRSRVDVTCTPYRAFPRHISMSEPVSAVRSDAELEQPSSSRAQHASLHVTTSPLNQRNDEEARSRSRSRTVRVSGMIRGRLMSLGSRMPNPSYTLENTGSVARDHLANERTWLAYLRTSLALASTGVGLVQLFTISAAKSNDPSANTRRDLERGSNSKMQRFARPLGGITVALAIIVLMIGAYRYFRIQKALTVGRFPPARQTMALINGSLMAVVIVIFGVLVGTRQA